MLAGEERLDELGVVPLAVEADELLARPQVAEHRGHGDVLVAGVDAVGIAGESGDHQAVGQEGDRVGLAEGLVDEGDAPLERGFGDDERHPAVGVEQRVRDLAEPLEQVLHRRTFWKSRGATLPSTWARSSSSCAMALSAGP